MKRAIIVTALVSGLAGVVVGAAGWYLFSPLFIDRVVAEAAPVSSGLQEVASGAFRDADSAHRGTGTATILTGGDRAILRFTEFEVTNGPDLEVWLVEAGDIQSSSDVTASQWVSLGTLKGNVGDQNYDIPAGTDPNAYRSVVIWCEQFGVLFSPADLVPAGS